MTIGTRIDSVQGPVVTNNSAGTSIARDTANVGFAPFKVDSMLAVTASMTLGAGHAGVTTLSGATASVITGTMPTAASCPGAEFIFRTKSVHNHVLTGSQETAGTKVFNLAISSSVAAPAVGSKLVLGSVVGSSVVLKSDGLNFHVLSFSGSLTVA